MNQTFYYFDGSEERDAVVAQVKAVREEIIHIARQVPEQHHYVPRYSGRSLAQLLVHLYLADAASLWLIKTSAGLREDWTLRIPRLVVGQAHNVLMRFFNRRRVQTTLLDLERLEEEVCELIEDIDMDVLHKDVYQPGRREPYTVERAVQVFFVGYWERQLELMRQVEGVAGERS
ncbi:MAG: hypothetical protein AAF125_12670 [Chloroflexota bacterium]